MRVGSMFAGIGGICFAFKSAGADLVWANEIDRFACATYKHNFGDDYLVEGDIRSINSKSIPDIDVLTAGFPCQSFSVMGKQQGFCDPRGTMYFEILKVIDAKKPEIVLLENVKNLVNHDNGRTFLTIYNTLAERGYGVKYAVLGANTHGNIPQYRDRIFIGAFLDYDRMNKFSFPKEMPLEKSINDIIDRKALHHESYYYTEKHKLYSALVNRVTDTNGIYRIDDSGIAKKLWELCPTLKAHMGTYPDRVPIIKDAYGIRKLTPYECLALQGFSSDYKFPKIPINEAYKQIGNTVCVPVVRGIVEKIVEINYTFKK